ncbi:unnamed protein product, partial [Prorocentrum cordatum]
MSDPDGIHEHLTQCDKPTSLAQAEGTTQTGEDDPEYQAALNLSAEIGLKATTGAEGAGDEPSWQLLAGGGGRLSMAAAAERLLVELLDRFQLHLALENLTAGARMSLLLEEDKVLEMTRGQSWYDTKCIRGMADIDAAINSLLGYLNVPQMRPTVSRLVRSIAAGKVRDAANVQLQGLLANVIDSECSPKYGFQLMPLFYVLALAGGAAVLAAGACWRWARVVERPREGALLPRAKAEGLRQRAVVLLALASACLQQCGLLAMPLRRQRCASGAATRATTSSRTCSSPALRAGLAARQGRRLRARRRSGRRGRHRQGAMRRTGGLWRAEGVAVGVPPRGLRGLGLRPDRHPHLYPGCGLPHQHPELRGKLHGARGHARRLRLSLLGLYLCDAATMVVLGRCGADRPLAEDGTAAGQHLASEAVGALAVSTAPPRGAMAVGLAGLLAMALVVPWITLWSQEWGGVVGQVATYQSQDLQRDVSLDLPADVFANQGFLVNPGPLELGARVMQLFVLLHVLAAPAAHAALAVAAGVQLRGRGPLEDSAGETTRLPSKHLVRGLELARMWSAADVFAVAAAVSVTELGSELAMMRQQMCSTVELVLPPTVRCFELDGRVRPGLVLLLVWGLASRRPS